MGERPQATPEAAVLGAGQEGRGTQGEGAEGEEGRVQAEVLVLFPSDLDGFTGSADSSRAD